MVDKEPLELRKPLRWIAKARIFTRTWLGRRVGTGCEVSGDLVSLLIIRTASIVVGAIMVYKIFKNLIIW